LFHEYEIIVIIRPDIDDADVKLAIERVEGTLTELGSQVVERDDWGKRKLAYLIQKHSKGHYVLFKVAANPTHILEVERRMRIDDRIIRFLTVKMDEFVDLDTLKEQAEERRIARATAAANRRDDHDHDDDDDDDDDYESAAAYD
jgi:small subunit ribosomal protein S6